MCFGEKNIGPQMTEGDTWSRTDGRPVGRSMYPGRLVQIVQEDGHPALGPWD